VDCLNLKPTAPALATDTQYPLPNGDPHAPLNDFDAFGHSPDPRQIRGIARVPRYVLILLQDSEKLGSVDQVR
jgi:hypothetical protein